MKERKPRKEPRVKIHTTDISMSGIRFSADWHMPHDMPIKVTVIFKSPTKPFHHFAYVRQVQRSSEPNRFLTGIEFVQKDEDSLVVWRAFLLERYPELT